LFKRIGQLFSKFVVVIAFVALKVEVIYEKASGRQNDLHAWVGGVGEIETKTIHFRSHFLIESASAAACIGPLLGDDTHRAAILHNLEVDVPVRAAAANHAAARAARAKAGAAAIAK